MTRVVLLRSPLTQRVRNFVVKHGFSIPVIRHAIANRLSGIQINYSDSPLNMGSARGLRGPEPGQRLISGRSAGRDDVPRFILLARNSAEARVMIARHSDLLASEVRLPPDGNGIWLVRPDGYVAAAAKSGDWKVIDMALNGMKV